jgi:hypothetical protein
VINKILTDKMQRKPQKKIQVYHIITSASGYYELKKKKNSNIKLQKLYPVTRHLLHEYLQKKEEEEKRLRQIQKLSTPKTPFITSIKNKNF